jgi:hypothetical protein
MWQLGELAGGVLGRGYNIGAASVIHREPIVLGTQIFRRASRSILQILLSRAGWVIEGFCWAGPVVDDAKNAPFEFQIYGSYVSPASRHRMLAIRLVSQRSSA